MELQEQVRKCKRLAGVVRSGFFRLDVVKDIPYQREVLNIRELLEEMARLEKLASDTVTLSDLQENS